MKNKTWTRVFVLVSGIGGYGATAVAQEATPDSEPSDTFFSDSEFDDLTLEVTSGGTVDAGRFSRRCQGMIDLDSPITFDLSSEQSIVFETESDSDTTLVVALADSRRWYCDDDSGDGQNARVEIDQPRSGQYQVWVGNQSVDVNETGAATLLVTQSIEEGRRRVNRPDYTERGALTDEDEELDDGRYVDRYEFEAEIGHRITIDLNSPEFDTYLRLISPEGKILENDDMETIHHSQIRTEFVYEGTYRIEVTSYGPKETGDYILTYDIEAPSTDDGSTPSVVEMDIGDTYDAVLTTEDRRLDSGKYVDMYSFEASRGDFVRIEMRSEEFDTYLMLRSPAGESYRNDDYDGSLELSVIEFTVPHDGRYRIMATTYAPGRTGNYEMEILSLRNPPLHPTESDGRGGTVYGIFAGISDYSMLRRTDSAWGDLNYTAKDAFVAHDHLIEYAGMDPENGFLFTNHEATRVNIEAAFEEIAQRIRPNDTFVFFYSGHGGQEMRDEGFDAADADGYDETLALSDGTITDDEVRELFDTIDAYASLIVLDSCFAGGFAKDIVSAPGRMGLFSSDEDVPSLVAETFEAGGYLSYFFSEAFVDGAADDNGDDYIDAMELSQYLQVRYNEESMAKGPSDFDTPNFGWQHLVVDRGGVPHDALLFHLE